MNYKDQLYKAYVNTHIIRRKKAGDIKEFSRRAITYQKIFGSYLPKNKEAKIIDLGCGPGSIVWWLKHQGYINVAGVDISEEQVEIAHDLGLDSVVLADIFDFLSTRDEQYDVFFARDVLEHLDKESAFRFLLLCLSKLKSGGKLILQVPNAESPFFGRIRYGDFTHEFALTPSSAMQIGYAAGFNKVFVFPIRPTAVGVRSTFRLLCWYFIETIIKFIVRVESPNAGSVVTTNLLIVAIKS